MLNSPLGEKSPGLSDRPLKQAVKQEKYTDIAAVNYNYRGIGGWNQKTLQFACYCSIVCTPYH